MIYICGDSFGVPDPEHGPMWVDLLQKDFEITNLSRVCASNLMISQQLDLALKSADYIILLCTSSTRSQARIGTEVVPYSVLSLDSTTPFDQSQLKILRQHAAEFFDLSLAIYENQCIIESMLCRLSVSGVEHCWDQGGFEHPSYGGVGQYFDRYADRRSALNLWDYADQRSHRPYYHITDHTVHQRIANYYREKIRGKT